MPGIAAFNDFMKATGPSYFSGAKAVINEAARRNYFFRAFARGKAEARTVQAGTKIKDTILLSVTSTYRAFRPNDPYAPMTRDGLVEHEINWSYGVDEMTWTDQEVEHNSSDEFTEAAVKSRFKNIKWTKEQGLWTSVWEGLDSHILFSPYNNTTGASNKSLMEGSGNLQPLSIFVIMAEQSNGAPTGWAVTDTVAGLAPQAGWRPQQVFYDAQKPLKMDTTVTSATERQKAKATTVLAASYHATSPYYPRNGVANLVYNLRSALGVGFHLLHFQSPMEGDEFFEASKFQNQIIFTSLAGIELYELVCYSSNDRLKDASDASVMNVTYAGCKMQYIAGLDSATPCPAHSGAVTQTIAAACQISAISGSRTEDDTRSIFQGPRYYMADAEWIVPVLHKRKFMKKQDPRRDNNKVGTWVQPVECWWNLFPRSRNRLCVVIPHPAA